MNSLNNTVLRALAVYCTIFKCSNYGSAESEHNEPRLLLLSTHSLEISEPSGLTINETGTVLWTVSDNCGQIIKLDLQGNVKDTLYYIGNDLEGIAYDPSDTTLWVIEENQRALVHLDISGNVLSRQPLDLTGLKDSGLEGICLDDQGNIYVLNEKDPGLFIALNTDFSIKTQYELNFADDYSGLAYDSQQKCFWVLSDQSETLSLWSAQYGIVRKFLLSFPKAEGVVIDNETNRIYIVSDSQNRLYVFRVS